MEGSSVCVARRRLGAARVEELPGIHVVLKKCWSEYREEGNAMLESQAKLAIRGIYTKVMVSIESNHFLLLAISP